MSLSVSHWSIVLTAITAYNDEYSQTVLLFVGSHHIGRLKNAMKCTCLSPVSRISRLLFDVLPLSSQCIGRWTAERCSPKPKGTPNVLLGRSKLTLLSTLNTSAKRQSINIALNIAAQCQDLIDDPCRACISDAAAVCMIKWEFPSSGKTEKWLQERIERWGVWRVASDGMCVSIWLWFDQVCVQQLCRTYMSDPRKTSYKIGAALLQSSAKRHGCLLSFSQAEPGRELTQHSPRLLTEPSTIINLMQYWLFWQLNLPSLQ